MFTVVAQDVTADGRPDLIVASDYDDVVGITVSTRAGDGMGNFGAPLHTSLSTSAHPTAMALADVNGDGKQDVVVADSALYRVDVLLGDGNGRWSTPMSFGTCEEPQSIAARRLDRDDYADVVVACRDDGGAYLDVFYGSSSGALGGRTTYHASPGTVAFGVATGDVDADGDVDVITTGIEEGSGIRVHFNDGTGALTPADRFSGGKQTTALFDFDSDGKLDLAAVDDDVLNVFSGTGGGRFTLATSVPLGGVGSSIAVGPIDRGSDPDIVVSKPDDDLVAVLWGSGDAARWTRQDVATADGPERVVMADFDRDGVRDVVTANHSVPGTLTLLRQESQSTP